MNNYISQVEWKSHRIGLILLVISILLAIYSGLYMSDMKTQKESINHRISEQEQLNSTSTKQKEIYDEVSPAFNNLKDRGIVGNTKRLQWLETIRATTDLYLLPQLNFSLENTKMSNQKEDLYVGNGFNYETTLMKLKFKIMHEGDFFNMFRFLRDTASGIFSVEKCEVKRVSTEGRDPSIDELIFPGLEGNCALKWYTFPELSEQNASVFNNEPL